MAFVCKVELDQTKGLTLTVINADGNITQTTTFDGTTMTHTCKGADATSTITQNSTDIIIACTNFTVNADTISCNSTKNTTHTAEGTFGIDSAKDASINSSADLTVSATTKLTMTCADFSVTGDSTAKVTSATTTINGDKKASVTGASLALTATSDANLKGATVKAAADTTMNVEGLTTTVKGTTTNIQGSLITLG
jgi:hypothetical protein